MSQWQPWITYSTVEGLHPKKNQWKKEHPKTDEPCKKKAGTVLLITLSRVSTHITCSVKVSVTSKDILWDLSYYR